MVDSNDSFRVLEEEPVYLLRANPYDLLTVTGIKPIIRKKIGNPLPLDNRLGLVTA
jgi:hypothetical protein